jgi:hypothetical protein
LKFEFEADQLFMLIQEPLQLFRHLLFYAPGSHMVLGLTSSL